MQRNANMLKNLKKKLRFADFMGFFAKMQSPACHPKSRLSLEGGFCIRLYIR